jgi:Family of unknown function (DUF6062)
MSNSSVSDAGRTQRIGWFTASALRKALSKPGCVICEALNASVRCYIFSFLYEGMMSGDVREKFLEGGGFCAQHFRQAKEIEDENWADGFGVAILCQNLLERILPVLNALDVNQNGTKRGLSLKHRKNSLPRLAGERCMVCELAQQSEARYMEALEELLGDPSFADQYRQSAGLCLPHVPIAFHCWTSPAAVGLVGQGVKKQAERLVSKLEEFQRKHDYQYKHEPRGAEWSSPGRAIEFLIGSHIHSASRNVIERGARR